ncbi:SdrD B-like domain-containing protein, partial [Arthrospira platensis SPKY2]
GNAEQEWNEPGIPGVNVILEVWDGSDWVTYDVTTTNASGNYLFTGLPAGEYRVVVDAGNGSPIANSALIGDPDTDGRSCLYLAELTPGDDDYFYLQFCDNAHTVEIIPGRTYLGANFGYQPASVI